MIKKSIVSIFCFSIMFFSCSNANVSSTLTDAENNLRNQAEQKTQNILWSDTQSATDDTAGVTEIPFYFGNAKAVFFVQFKSDEPLYPTLNGFASLDTRAISAELAACIDVFFRSVQAGDISENVFPENKLYLKTLIEYEFKDFPKLLTWIVGKPVVSSDPTVFEIPVRLLYDGYFSHSIVYCSEYSDGFKIDQMQIGALQNE
ncbi:MAG: hypothetical protein R3Y36_04165 [Spirochaetales bacterium]